MVSALAVAAIRNGHQPRQCRSLGRLYHPPLATPFRYSLAVMADDLDNLLGELSSHKVTAEPVKAQKAIVHKPTGFKAPPPSSHVSGGEGDEIDAIIANINFDPKAEDYAGICSHCRKGIVVSVEYVQIGDKKYHMEHWTCTTCAKRLGGDDFFEARPGTHDCLSCYKKSLPVCGLCHKEIEGGVQMAEAEGRKFHQSCFVCTVCRVPLQEYHDPDGRYYCKKHFAETFNPKCHACGKAIENTYAQDAEGHKYHTHCFKCAKCGTAIGGGKYFEKNGQIVCPNCK